MKTKYIQQITKNGYPRVDRFSKSPVYHEVSGAQEMAPFLLLDKKGKSYKYRLKTFLELGYEKTSSTKRIQTLKLKK